MMCPGSCLKRNNKQTEAPKNMAPKTGRPRKSRNQKMRGQKKRKPTLSQQETPSSHPSPPKDEMPLQHDAPEILAPAQDMEAVFAATKAGADAVYLGLQAFNARQRGANFTLPALSECIAFCHQNDVKVYVTLNTVVKEQELSYLVKCLSALAAQKADGVIVQDLGVARLVRDHCPDVMLHGSTQLAVHNLDGVKQAAALGFHRVILARELTQPEVLDIAGKSPLPLEIFVHGSYCYSFSGMCLASSFLGGFSGNRGWCTQACRRPYMNRGRYQYLFSMSDLSMAGRGDLLRAMPVASWKIEGRMKYPDYIFNTVKAYRLLRQGDDAEAKRLLTQVKTRVFSPGYLGMADPNSLTCPNLPGFSGQFLGKVKRTGQGGMTLKINKDVSLGQKLRLQAADTEKGRGFRVKWMTVKQGAKGGTKNIQQARTGQTIQLNAPRDAQAGDLVFLVSQAQARFKGRMVKPASWQKQANRLEKKIAAAVAEPLPDLADTDHVALTLETDDPAVARSAIKPVDKVLLWLTDRIGHTLTPHFIKKMQVPVGVVLPPVLLPEKVDAIRERLADFAAWGIQCVEVNNLGAWDLVPEGLPVQAGPYLYAHNHQAALALRGLECRQFVFPLEGDLDTLTALTEKGLAPALEVSLYGTVPLFISRAGVQTKGGRRIQDSHGGQFLLKGRDGLTWLWGMQPYCGFAERPQLQKEGIRRFRISLLGKRFPADGLRGILNHYRRHKDMPGATQFNWSAGLK